VSAGTAISVLMVAETFGTDRGLGFYIIDSWMRADYVQMYFGILILSLIGFVIFITLDFAEHKVCGWKR
jgi:NitT/TauT family transport system permease protein